MASSLSTNLSGVVLGWCGLNGTPLTAPREWESAYLLIDGFAGPWEQLTLTRNTLSLPVTQRHLNGRVQVVAEWPRANPGRYQLCLIHLEAVWRTEVTVLPQKITAESVQQLLNDLHERLPATVALSLKRAGGLASVSVADLKPATPTEEFYRLKRALLGSAERPSLRQLLTVIARKPQVMLTPYPVTVRRELLKRPRGAELVRALTGAPSRLARLPDERVRQTADVYENRVVKACLQLIERRLRHLAGRTPWSSAPGQSLSPLHAELAAAHREVPFLSEVDELRVAPTRITMVLLRRQEYRSVLEILLELQRSLRVSLDDDRLLEPMNHLPELYQTWCTLSVLETLTEMCISHGYELVQEGVTRALPGSLLIQVLPNQVPLLTFRHRGSGIQITLKSERTFSSVSRIGLHSVSFQQRPDLTIEVNSPGHPPRLWLLDPKYKLDSELLVAVPGSPELLSGRPKKLDIDKMHAYRDAIRWQDGTRVVEYAAILYPGPSQAYSSGLAALCAVPGQSAVLTEGLRSALLPLF